MADFDIDAVETHEWLQALTDVLKHDGSERAQFLVSALAKQLGQTGLGAGASLGRDYVNTIALNEQAQYPGDLEIEARIREIIRWNAVAMVIRGGHFDPSLGGHLASYASAAVLYEVGFNHHFRADSKDQLGDLVYIQGHSSPGIYSRAFLEGRLSEQQLADFRQDLVGGVCSYPHPREMSEFWQFPTVSMGLGPLTAIYQAKFLKYLDDHKLTDQPSRKVWCFCGDGEMDEPESLGAIGIARNAQLDNLVFVINCNLQRLDGPVRGNASIVRELEGIFQGADWNVIKVMWGTDWDPLFERDKSGLLVKRMNECIDGEYQSFKAHDGKFVRENFFGKYPELAELVKDMSDADIAGLRRGGHDPLKVNAAYAKAKIYIMVNQLLF